MRGAVDLLENKGRDVGSLSRAQKGYDAIVQPERCHGRNRSARSVASCLSAFNRS